MGPFVWRPLSFCWRGRGRYWSSTNDDHTIGMLKWLVPQVGPPPSTLVLPLTHSSLQLHAFGSMGFPSGIPAPTHWCRFSTDGLQLLAEHGDALWIVILNSPRGSQSYRDALAALLSSDHEQKLLYTLRDRFAIEGMLNVLELVSLIHARIFPTRMRIPETFPPKGITGD